MQNEVNQVRSWAEVSSSDKFLSLSLENQERARELYYQDNVAPRVPKGMEQRARALFDQDTLAVNDQHALDNEDYSYDADAVDSPAQGGIEAMDFVKEAGGGALTGTGAMISGAGDLVRPNPQERAPVETPNGEFTPLSARIGSLTDPVTNAIANAIDAPARAVGEWLSGKGKAISDSKTDAAKEALKASTPTGDIDSPSTWSMGEDPSVAGYGLHLANLAGQFGPQAGAMIATKGRSIQTPAMMGIGGLQAGGSAGDEVEQRITETLDADLQASSGLYQKLRQTMPEQEARKSLIETARSAAFDGAAPVGALGGLATQVALGPLQRSIGGSVGRKLAAGTLIEAPLEGLQEVAETTEARRSTNKSIEEDRSLTEGTFGDFALGALGGTGFSVAGTALSGKDASSQASADEVSQEPESTFENTPAPLAIEGPGLQGLPQPGQVFYGDSQGGMQDIGPIKSVDGVMQPTPQSQQWVNPNNRTDAQASLIGGEGMEAQTPRGAPAGLQGQFIPSQEQQSMTPPAKMGLMLDGNIERLGLPEPEAFVVDSEGNTQRGATAPQVFNEPPMKGGAGMDQQAPTAPPKQQKSAPKAMPDEKSPQERAQYSWDSMNTFERNAAAANILGARGVLAKNTATKAWNKLSSEQQAKLVTGLESQQGKRWIDPNQKVTDQTGPVLQNRDRTSQDSINQMRSISNNPDYSRLKTSGFLSDGAPVVVDENIQIPVSQVGVTDTASAGSERFNVQYAVVEADQLMTSNSIDGTTNAEYQTGAAGKARAIAGNGRITGLQSAWAKGNASQYKADMAVDRMHGIAPAVIEGMRNPILVRLLPQDQVTDNIGDLSNRDEKGRLSPVEQAKTDMGRIDLDSLKFTAEGAIGGEAIHQFRMAQPAAERVSEAEARKRLTSAIFQKAYGNDQLTEIQSGESDDAKSIMSALAQAAPSMSRLEGAGEFDVRPLVTQAGIAAVNAARRGTKLADYVQQSEMGIDPMVYPILEMMLNDNGNIRSSKYIGEQLTNMAKLAYDEANSPSSDMFGEKPKRTAEQVIQDALTGVQGYGQINDGRGQESLGQPGRSEPDAQMVEGPEGGRERPADTRQTAPAQQEPARKQPETEVTEKPINLESTETSVRVYGDVDTIRQRLRAEGINFSGAEIDGGLSFGKKLESKIKAVFSEDLDQEAMTDMADDTPIEMVQAEAVAPWGDRSFTLYVDEEYGPPPPHTKAYEAAKSAPKGSVTHGLTVRPSGKQWHNLYLSHGNGDFSSVSVGKDMPSNTAELIEQGFSDYDNKQKKQANALEEKNAISAKEVAIAKENNLVLGRELGTIIPNTGKQFKSAKIIADHGDGTFTLRGVQGNKQAELRGLSASSIVRAMDRQNLQSGAKSEGSTPETWRKNYLLAKKRATELGLDPKEHGKLPGLVKAIDAAIAEKAKPEAPALDLAQQTEETLAAEAERLEQLQKEEAAQKAKQKAAESKARERDADKARADEVVDDFQLGQQAEEVMSGMGDIFATESKPADKGIAAQDNDSQVTVVDDQYNPNPTEAQKQAGNYKKAHVKFQGLDITIENPVGSERSGVDPDGNAWSNTIKHDYGYIKRTTGADGDHVDVFIGKDTDSDKVFVIDQPHKNGKFDEHKVMLGFKGRVQAVAAYKGNYQKGWKVGPITEMTVGEFKQWLSNGDTTKPVETVAKPAAEQAKPNQAVEDYGEKMAGAIKDQPKTSLSENLTDEDIASQALSKIWPAKEVMESDDDFIAAFAYVARSRIPAKPRVKYKIDRWVKSVQGSRRFAQSAATGKITIESLSSAATIANSGLEEYANKVKLLMQIDRKDWGRIGDIHDYSKAYRFDDEGNKQPSPHISVNIDGVITKIDGATTIEETFSKVKKAVSKDSKVASENDPRQFEIRTVRSTGDIFINRKGDKEYRELKSFKKGELAAARDFVRNNTDDLAAEWEAVKERDNVSKADVRGDTNAERAGKDYRNGKDVTSEEFGETFGFRGVEFGNWVSQGKGQADRQGMLNAAYDALLDLASIVGVPPKAISLNGSLGIAFGSRGKGKASAHYETDNIVINLTKTKGAGSLAHEWFHALDNYFSRSRGVTPFDGNNAAYNKANYITYKPEPMMALKTSLNKKGIRPYLITKAEYDRRVERGVNFDAADWTPDTNHPAGVRPKVEKAFAGLVNELDKSPMLARAEKIDKGKVDGYWSSIIERAARSFESYVIQRLEDQGISNQYLANVVTLENFKRDEGRYPYLTNEELKPVAEKFDTLFSTIESRETDSGVQLYKTDSKNNAAGIKAEAITDALASTPELAGVKVVQSFEDLPARARKQAEIDGVNPGDLNGIYVNGTSYVVADNHATVTEAVRTAVHEEVGHLGIRGLLGDKLTPTMERIYSSMAATASGRKLIKDIRADYGHLRDKDQRQAVAEELIAHLIETGDKPTLVQRFVSKVRELLRTMFPQVKWTNLDVLALGEQSRAWLRRGMDAEKAGTRYSAKASDKPQTKTAAFKKWFGNSKVVDANGDPKVLYHGTASDISEFKGMVWGSENADLANDYAFLRGQETEAGEVIMPLYMSAQAPFDSDLGLSRYVTAAEFFNAMVEQAQDQGRSMSQADIARLSDLLDVVDKASKREESGPDYRRHSFWNYPSMSFGDDGAKAIQDALKLTGFDSIKMIEDGQVTYGAFKSEQVKSTTGNNGDFDGTNPDIRYSLKSKKNKHTSESFSDLTDKQKAALNKIAPLTTQQKAAEWFRDKTDRALLKIRQGLVDRFAALRELDEAAFGEDILNTDITSSSWVLARMSSAASGALHAMLNNGRIYLDQKQKVIDIQDGDALGLGATLARLGSPAEIERFMGWIAGNRSARLAAEGRENLFNADDIDALKTLNNGKTDSGKTRKALYDDVFKEFQQYRDDILAIAEQTGIITAENRALWRDEFYVPFYRVMDEEAKVGGPGGTKGLTRQEAYKKLKGGKQNLNDLLQNTMLNFNHLLTASLKNQAAAQALSNAEQIGVAEKTTEAARDKKASTFVLVDGKQQWYNIDDPLVFEALSMISDGGLNTSAVKVMSFFKRTFTNMTTITPQFIIANLLRDSMQATATSPVSKNFLKNIVTGGKDWTDGKKRARMMATGGAFSFGHIYNNDPHEMKAHLTRNLTSAQLLSSTKLIPTALRAGWDAWNSAASAAENSNRAAIFSQNEQSKGKLAAAFEARDLMDFSMNGAWPAVRFLIRVVPFLNARLQGLDKLYRSGVKPSLLTAFGKGNATDKQAAKRFLAVVGALSAASMALMMVNNDDEEYRKLEEWQKDTYWFVRFGSKAYFIPKPFEVGVIATIAERLMQQGIDDKATGELFRKRMGHALTQTFSFSPVPHAFQPILDVYSNMDAFTERPIESMGMDRLSKGLRSRPDTTAPAKALSAVSRSLGDDFPLAVSPVQADHLIAGYLGQVGAWGAGLVDTMWRTAKGETQPARHWHEYQPIRRFYKDLDTPNAYTRYSTLFYEGLRESSKAYADVSELQKLGREDQAREAIESKRDILSMRTSLNKAQRQLSKINNRIGMVRIGGMDADEKRREIDRLNVIKSRITEAAGKQIEDMKAKR